VTHVSSVSANDSANDRPLISSNQPLKILDKREEREEKKEQQLLQPPRQEPARGSSLVEKVAPDERG
jgi:hypothetical protein